VDERVNGRCIAPERTHLGDRPGTRRERQRCHDRSLRLRERPRRFGDGVDLSCPRPPGFELRERQISHVARGGSGQHRPPEVTLGVVELGRDVEAFRLGRAVIAERSVDRVSLVDEDHDERVRAELERDALIPRGSARDRDGYRCDDDHVASACRSNEAFDADVTFISAPAISVMALSRMGAVMRAWRVRLELQKDVLPERCALPRARHHHE
jgi:hypothetical protein